jgi:RNA polymerase sigma-70 factor (ECF subfamily)
MPSGAFVLDTLDLIEEDAAPVARAAAPRFEAVYRDHFAFVWRSLRALGVPAAALDDGAQEVFVVVHRRLAEFEGRSTLKSWLFGIARGVAANQRRSLRRRAEDAVVADDQLVCQAPGPREAAERSQALGEVLALLERLDEDKRVVFALVELEGLSAPEVAELLDVKLNTVYSRLRLARAEMERALERLRARERGGER